MPEVVMPRIADMLRFSGTVLGHYDGLDHSFLDDRVLVAALEEAGLHDWIVLFNSELSQLWDRRQKWASFNEFLMLRQPIAYSPDPASRESCRAYILLQSIWNRQ